MRAIANQATIVAAVAPASPSPSAAAPTRTPRPIEKGRFLIGGSIYDGWTAVPDRFKVEDPKRPDPNKATLGIFRFVW